VVIFVIKFLKKKLFRAK